jgi:hypothetical protein
LRRLGTARLVKQRGVRLDGVEALEAGTFAISASAFAGRGSRASARVPVLYGKRTFTSAGRATLRLRLTKAGRRVLRRTRRLELTLRGRFADRSGRVTRSPGRRVLVRP